MGTRLPRHERGHLPLLLRAVRQPRGGLDRWVSPLRPGLGAHPLDPGERGAWVRVVGLGYARYLPHLRYCESLQRGAPEVGLHARLGVATLHEDIVAAARALAAEGLVTAFGHVSAREVEQDGFLITPPRPLGSLGPDEPLLEVSLDEDELPEGVPGEAWIHWAIYNGRPDVAGVCRAQPQISTALASASVPIRPLHGQGAFLGEEVPVYNDARLIRDREAGEALAES